MSGKPVELTRHCFSYWVYSSFVVVQQQKMCLKAFLTLFMGGCFLWWTKNWVLPDSCLKLLLFEFGSASLPVEPISGSSASAPEPLLSRWAFYSGASQRYLKDFNANGPGLKREFGGLKEERRRQEGGNKGKWFWYFWAIISLSSSLHGPIMVLSLRQLEAKSSAICNLQQLVKQFMVQVVTWAENPVAQYLDPAPVSCQAWAVLDNTSQQGKPLDLTFGALWEQIGPWYLRQAQGTPSGLNGDSLKNENWTFIWSYTAHVCN